MLYYDVWALLAYRTKLKGRVRMIGTENVCVTIKKKSGENVLEFLLSLFDDFLKTKKELEKDCD